MARQMPRGLQIRKLKLDLVKAGLDPELVDIEAHLDSTLSLPENRKNLQRLFGYRIGSMTGEKISLFHQQSKAHYRKTAQKPRKKPQKRRNTRGMKPLPAWQSDPWPKATDPIDRQLKAKPPGRRISKRRTVNKKRVGGNIYYERRKNRSDMPGTTL